MKDGGQAFPLPMTVMGEHVAFEPEYGMTLRDYFAAKAMLGWMGGLGDPVYAKALHEQATSGGMSPCQQLAQLAYEQADAMLAEREKGAK